MSPSIPPAPLKPELFQTTTCLHFLLRCWWLHHRRRRTGGPTRRIFLPNIVGHWANVIHRLSAGFNPSDQARKLQFDPMSLWRKKNGIFFGKRETHKVVWNRQKRGIYLWTQIYRDNNPLCMYCISIFGVVVYAMRSTCLRDPSIRNYNVVYLHTWHAWIILSYFTFKTQVSWKRMKLDNFPC